MQSQDHLKNQNESDLNMNGFAPRFILTQRQKGKSDICEMSVAGQNEIPFSLEQTML